MMGCFMMSESESISGRVMVLEEAKIRIEKDVGKIKEEITDLKLAVNSLPGIESALKEMSKDIKKLNECKIASESKERQKTTFLDRYGGLINYVIFMIVGVVVAILWQSAMHIRYGGT
jgi:septal ring factor EnvC (AmiA/AmiB activator)